MRESRIAYVIILIVLVSTSIVPLWFAKGLITNMFILFYLNAAMALAWNIIGGLAGQVSFGHTIFYGIGAYTSSLLWIHWGLSPWIGCFLGALLATTVGYFVGLLCFRLRGVFFALATLVIAEVGRQLVTYFRNITGGSIGLTLAFSPGLKNMIFLERWPYIFLMLGLLLLIICVTVWIQSSSMGIKLLALREDEEAAEGSGVNTHALKVLSLLISSFFTALGGSFYAQYIQFIDPHTVFSVNISLQMVLMSILGGIGTVYGPILGALIVTPLWEVIRSVFASKVLGLHYIIYGVMLMVIVATAPRGLLTLVAGFIRKVRKNT